MKELELKYGCNPNQKPSKIFVNDGRELPITVLNGKPGYINFMDAFNGWQLVKELKEATGLPAATSCQPLNASIKLMYPGLPFKTVMGSSRPSFTKILLGFWLGLQPYLSSNSFIIISLI